MSDNVQLPMAQKDEGVLPSVDDVLGARDQRPSVDEILGAPTMPIGHPLSGEAWDDYLKNSPTGRVLDAFGQGAAQGWGTGSIGLSDETADALKKAGLFNDLTKGQHSVVRSINEAVIRGAAVGLDSLMRAGQSLFGAGQAAVAQIGQEAGAPQLGRDIAALPEAFMGEPFSEPGHIAAAPVMAPTTAAAAGVGAILHGLSPDLSAARSLGVIGEGEGGYLGTKPPTEMPESVVIDSVRRQQAAAANANEVGGAPASYAPQPSQPTETPIRPYGTTISPDIAEITPPADVHEAARQIAPQTFQEYDELDRQRDLIRDRLTEAQQNLEDRYQAAAPHTDEIADLENRLEDTTPRLAKKYQARLEQLVPERDAWLADEENRSRMMADTPEMASMRRLLQETDYRMRDLAPDVSHAYAEAAKQFPAQEEEAPQPPAEIQETHAGEELPSGAAKPAEAVQPAARLAAEESQAAEVAPTSEQQVPPQEKPYEPERAAARGVPVNIAEDVAQKLVAAGRPEGEARAAAQIIQSYYETRAARFGGARGAPEEIYGREAPEIRSAASKAPVRELELAQRERILDQAFRPKFAVEWTRALDDIKAGKLTPRNTVVSMGRAPEALKVAGLPDREIYYRRGEIQKTVSGKHAGTIDEETMRRLPDLIRDPIMVVKQGNGRIGVLTQTADGHDVLTVIDPNARLGHQPVNLVMTTHVKDSPRALLAAVKNDRVLYADEGRGQQWVRAAQRQLPGETPIEGLGKNVVTKDELVNRLGKNYWQATRGKIRLGDGRAVITLMRDANASTFMHETGHAWLEDLMRDAADEAAPAQLKADAAKVREWLGVEEGADIPTRAHEKFARGFERYLMEGRAPTQALARVFQQFKDWLTSIYQTVARLRAPISDDIRDLFDRMLTTNPERSPAIVPETAAEREFGGSAARAAPATPYEKVPKEPTRLNAFVRKMGGIQEEGGEIKDMLGGDYRNRPGLVNSTGMSHDQMAIEAMHAGYFPGHEEQHTLPPNALLEKLREDLNGNPQYSMHDQDAVDAYQRALQHNHEIERLASEHDIDTKGLTAEQFFDHVTEKMTAEQVEREASDLERDAQTEAVEVESEIKDTGEHPDYGAAPARTLEDMEGAYGQEATARAVDQSQGVDERSGLAGGSPLEGEVGGGQDIHGAGIEGRPGAAAGAAEGGAASGGRSPEQSRPPSQSRRTDQPSSGTQRYGEPESDVIDKAGNIRLDLLTDQDVVRQTLREMAERSNDYMAARRGVVPEAQIIQLADDLSASAKELNIAKLRQMSVEDGIPLASRIYAGRQMLLQAEASVRDAAARGDAVSYIQAADRLNMIQETVSGITAEWGRAGHAFREMREETAGARNLSQIVQDTSGKTLFQIQREMKMVANLETPSQISKFTRDMARPGLFDWMQSAYINALLSGPFTHSTYTIAGELYGLFRGVVETGAAAAVGTIRRALNIGPMEHAEFGEVPHQVYGMFRGAVNGAKASWQAFKANAPRLPEEVQRQPELPGMMPNIPQGTIPNPEIGGVPVPIGTVLESPSRLVTALHTFNWTTFYSQSISSQAFRVAREEGLEGNALTNRIAELTASPTAAMVAEASEDATNGALMARPDPQSFMASISRLTNFGIHLPDIPLGGERSLPLGTFRPVKFIDPFVQIAANVQKTAFGRGTPFALFSQSVRDDLAMKNGGAAFDRTAGKLLAGTGLMIAAGSLAATGMLNGSGPSDPREAAEWRRINGMPHGLRIGDTSFDVLRLGPLGMQLSVAADLYHVGHLIGDEDATKVASEVVHAFAQNILDESFMRGPAELLRAAEDTDRYGSAWVRNFASSAIPFSVGLSQVGRLVDPYSRQARTTMDAIQAKIPFLSEGLVPRYDVWGQPVANRGWMGTYTQQIINDPTDRRLYELGVYPAMPGHRVRGVHLNDDQYGEYARNAGRMTKMRLDALLNQPGFSSLPEGIQIQTVHSTIDNAHETARTLLLMRHPEIIQQATQAKRDQLLGPHHQ